MSVIIIILAVAAAVLVGMAFVMGKQSGPNARAHARTLPKGADAVSNAATAPRKSDIKVNWLIGIGGCVDGQAFLVGHRMVTIGRNPTNFIQVTDEEASRTHTQITPRDGFLQVVDMNSRNGTLIDGKPVTQGRLMPGQALRVGDAIFRFHLTGDFERDASLERKEADAMKFASTIKADGQNLLSMLQATLEEAGGDFEVAAKELGIDANVLRHLTAQKGMTSGQ